MILEKFIYFHIFIIKNEVKGKNSDMKSAFYPLHVYYTMIYIYILAVSF